MPKEQFQKVPYGALRLVAQDCHAVTFQEEGSTGKKLNMTVYSGGLIKNHWWWGNLAVDISGVQFDRNKYPVLENHDTGRKLAFSKKPITKNNKIELDPDTTVFVDTEESREFQKLSSDGFPFQASMYAIPTVVERVSDDETVDVNGFKFKGPGSVWRRCLYQESSACVFGWDKNTEARAFSKNEFAEIQFEEVMTNKTQEGTTTTLNDGKEVSELPLTLEQLEKDAPDVLKQIQDAAVAAVTESFNTERTVLQNQIKALEGEKSALGDRVSNLEKAEIKRKDAEQMAIADAIWTAQLEASDIPVKRRDKIKMHVKVKDYLDKDDRLDTVKFTGAVVAEIKDWETDESQVLGGTGSLTRETDSEARKKQQLTDDNKKRSDALLVRAGQEVKK